MDQPSGSSWPLAVIGVLGAGGLWGFLSSVLKIRRSSPAETLTADAEFAEAAGKFAKDFGEAADGLVGHFRRELQVFSKRCDRLEAKNDELEAEVAGCKAHHQECQSELAKLREEFFLLKNAEPPPAYLPGFGPRDLAKPKP